MENTWTVVKFPDENDAVEAVPTSWLHNNLCYWPPFPKNVIREAIECCSSPEKSWSLFKFEHLKNNVAGSFQEAKKKVFYATQKSDLESDSQSCLERGLNKRKIFKKRFEPYSSFEEDEEADDFPEPPALKKPKMSDLQRAGASTSRIEDTPRSVSRNTLFGSTGNIQRTQSPSRGANLSSPAVFCSTNKDTSDNDTTTNHIILEHLKKLLKKQNILQSMMQDIVSDVSDLKKRLDKRDEDNTLQVQGHASSLLTELEYLPVGNEQELEEFETYLSDEDNMKKSVMALYKIGGKDVYDFLFRATGLLIADRFAGAEYSFLGRKSKKSFKALKLAELLGKAAQQQFKAATWKEIENDMAKWLRRCTERAKNKTEQL
ncbi:uncharacterized protein LOC126886403 isoform X2 [Diabrotica virgifera virgifera]|uniref:DUF4806 domain-containing protein n=1 Tax=Diabrotica virgifera virgifera TaxID=50390 RepID=A0ABM5KGG0_DIAVI|nr:uncharacterized protein LOC126886403 isoform X2 [Diabrotica virgifera virgifera]XP_050509290.1 uncharacterized protein LOC126886403 isoform X2 [Diabrotica virgifera virgifera]XP_050509291.1 uncharacterized protein LOC126886403 isoform X2 [Diabrotica virgifera virgifera]